jgi:ABC-2 type transport system ATP-binding protein
MRELIRRLADNATVILSTHIMQEVSAICDRALILRGGKVVLDERLDRLRASNRLAIRTASEGNLLEVLAGVPGIDALRQTGNGTWEAEISGGLDTLAESIVRRLIERSLPLYHLAPVQRDLETVFREVNEAAPADADAAEEAQHAV